MDAGGLLLVSGFRVVSGVTGLGRFLHCFSRHVDNEAFVRVVGDLLGLEKGFSGSLKVEWDLLLVFADGSVDGLVPVNPVRGVRDGGVAEVCNGEINCPLKLG